jgi:catechol 2,3-dioxygenase-like lactoylglutathione lyase family enzyme
VYSLLFVVCLTGCGQESPAPQVEGKPEEQKVETAERPNIIANNAFFYYKDLEAAWRFYEDILGLKTVADYDFAKIMRIAETSYLTLVDAESGMHSADEPKTVAIALITDQLDEWYEYLSAEKVPIRHDYKPVEGRPHHGFVVDDPEGYYLEFERFNPHPENEHLMPMLDEMGSIYPEPGSSAKTPKELGFKATVLWMYYNDLEGIQRFYEDIMGFDLVVDQGWAKIYPTSATGFIGPVDGAKGMHAWTEQKGVTVSFFTDDVDGWFAYLEDQESFEFRNPEVLMEDRAGVRVFVGYDPEGYFLEFDTFLETEGNEELVELLRRDSKS